MPVDTLLRERTQALAASLNSHRVLLYTALSTVAVSAAIANALKNYSNFYSVAIYLSKSSRSVLVLANFGFLVTLLCGRVVQQIFFGPLRPPEIERLYDRLWFFITESLLAFTIFRDEFDIPFALMFGFLLFVKSFHWLASDRIEWMEQRPYPGPPLLFHLRMLSLLLILWATDFVMLILAVENTLTHGVGGMILFASEYAILMASVASTLAKYILYGYELSRARDRGGENAPPWENKSMFVFYIELTTDFLKLTTYLVFFTLIITFYGLPLNIVRDVYITARSFITRLRALHRYQAATRNMDQRYPDATADEMTSMSDRTCIICREEMVLREPDVVGPREPAAQAPGNSDGPNTTPKKLPCGHIFHFHCLRSWLERQQSCPTCRRTVLETNHQGQQPPIGPRVPPVQPGGVPQPLNPAELPAAQPGPREVNNPLGFVGRLFGGAAQPQPPIVPGQFPHGQVANVANINPQNAANPGFVGNQVPQGVLIQYHIQYQFPRQQQQNPFPPPNPVQLVQPAPHFPGFYGPGGHWQPWGMDPQWFGNGPQNPAEAPNTDIPSPASPVPNMSQTQSSSNLPPSNPEISPSATSGSDGPSTPREAAAIAALRRLGTTLRETSANSVPIAGTTDSPEVVSPSPPAPPATASTSSATSGPTTNRAESRLNVPTIIPLHDYGVTPIPPQLNAAQLPFFRPPQAPRPAQAPLGTPSGTYRPYPRPTPQRAAQSDPRFYPQANSSRIPGSRLPPTLTDEQLSLMDRVTREAIDERLRVLEGVSGSIYRCIDDLMRMRSALPVMPAPNLPQRGVDPTGGPSGSVTEISDPRLAAEAVEEKIQTPQEAAATGSDRKGMSGTFPSIHVQEDGSSGENGGVEVPEEHID